MGSWSSARLFLVVTAAAVFGGVAPPREQAPDQLQVVEWRIPFPGRKVAPDAAQKNLVEDAQAMLVRAAVLTMESKPATNIQCKAIVTQAATDYQRIAPVHPSGPAYIPSHALARAELSLHWLPQQDDNADARDMHRLGMYVVALWALALEGEEAAINPKGYEPYIDSGWPSGTNDPAADYRPPDYTGVARSLNVEAARSLAATGGISEDDLTDLIAAFADQSLGGIKYLEEFRDAIARAAVQP